MLRPTAHKHHSCLNSSSRYRKNAIAQALLAHRKRLTTTRKSTIPGGCPECIASNALPVPGRNRPSGQALALRLTARTGPRGLDHNKMVGREVSCRIAIRYRRGAGGASAG
jgi:hypothetical protein